MIKSMNAQLPGAKPQPQAVAKQPKPQQAAAAKATARQPQPVANQPQQKSFASIAKFAPSGLKAPPASPDMNAFRKATSESIPKNQDIIESPISSDEDPYEDELSFNLLNYKKSRRVAREAELQRFLEEEMVVDFDYSNMEDYELTEDYTINGQWYESDYMVSAY